MTPKPTAAFEDDHDSDVHSPSRVPPPPPLRPLAAKEGKGKLLPSLSLRQRPFLSEFAPTGESPEC